MPITYAQNTEVTPDRSRSEIERTLERFGATGFAYGWVEVSAGRRLVRIDFQIAARHYRMLLPLVAQDDPEFTHTPTRQHQRAPAAAREAWEKDTRQRWRVLAEWIKAVLAAAEAGITTIDQALQPFVLLPNGVTVGEWLAPQIAAAYKQGQLPQLLPGLRAQEEGDVT
jgi:hypothetical protein